MNLSVFQRASQIRSVPFTGDPSDSDSEAGDLGRGLNQAPEDVLDGVLRGTCSSRNTTATTMTTMTSSTSGDMSLSSPRDLTRGVGVGGCLSGLQNSLQHHYSSHQPQQPHKTNFKHLLCPPTTKATNNKANASAATSAIASASTLATHNIKLGRPLARSFSNTNTLLISNRSNTVRCSKNGVRPITTTNTVSQM